MTSTIRTQPSTLLASLMFIGVALKLIAIYVYVPHGEPLGDVGFGFAPYLHTLIHSGRFAACDGAVCQHAERMPGIPLFLWATSFFTNELRLVAVVKSAVLSGLLYWVCRSAILVAAPLSPRIRFAIMTVAAFLVLSPNLVKHATSVHYEEGLLVDFLAISAVSLMSLVTIGNKPGGVSCYVVPVLAAMVAYLCKSSMLLVALFVVGATVGAALSNGRRKLAAVLTIVALSAPVGWGLHTWTHTDRVSIMSSYDGENLFRGWNANALDLYPNCTLDLLFASEAVCGGKKLTLPAQPDRASFADEWAWHDYYSGKAWHWVLDQPIAALKLFMVKCNAMFVTVDIVPHFRVVDGPHDFERTTLERWLAGAWLFGGRLMQIVWLVCTALVLRDGTRRARGVALVGLFLPLAYALPYVLGFAYERHYSLFILLVSICTLFLLPEATNARALRGGLISTSITTPQRCQPSVDPAGLFLAERQAVDTKLLFRWQLLMLRAQT